MKLTEIQDLIKFVAKSGVNEVELETKDIKITIRTHSGKGKEQVVVHTTSQPVTQVTASHQEAAPVVETKAAEVKSNSNSEEARYITVKAPMVGTFYRSSAPDKPLFVEVGD